MYELRGTSPRHALARASEEQGWIAVVNNLEASQILALPSPTGLTPHILRFLSHPRPAMTASRFGSEAFHDQRTFSFTPGRSCSLATLPYLILQRGWLRGAAARPSAARDTLRHAPYRLHPGDRPLCNSTLVEVSWHAMLPQAVCHQVSLRPSEKTTQPCPLREVSREEGAGSQMSKRA
jgi:hypothetical protein